MFGMLTQSRAAMYYIRMGRSAELMSVGTNREEMQFREPEIRDSLQILYMASRVQRSAFEELTYTRSGCARTHIPGITRLET